MPVLKKKPKDLKTPLRSLRDYCLWCCNGNDAEIRGCPATDCSLWVFRMGRGSRGKGGTLKPIRAKCLDCSTYSPAEVTACGFRECSLWHYRAGKNPFSNKRPSEEARRRGMEVIQERLALLKQTKRQA